MTGEQVTDDVQIIREALAALDAAVDDVGDKLPGVNVKQLDAAWNAYRAACHRSHMRRLLARLEAAERALAFIGAAGEPSGGELFPVGARGDGTWSFGDGRGATFLAAVEDAMRKATP